MKYLIQLFLDRGMIEQHQKESLLAAQEVAHDAIRTGVADEATVYECRMDGEIMDCVLDVSRESLFPEEYDTPVDPRADFDGDWNGHAW